MAENRIPVGIQLYSIRDTIASDVPGTLKQLAEMGYEGVEFAGTYDLPAATLRAMLDDAGLKCAGAHTGFPALEGDALAETVDFYRTLGTDRLIIPHANMGELDTAIERMKAIQSTASALGVKVGFHNHKAEFESVEGVTHFERIFGETPEDFLVQLDIGWAAAAGQDVPDILREYAKRIETVHVKEFDPNNEAAAVGEGIVDWPSVMDVMEKETAVQWYVVEQERYATTSMESVRTCIENIRKMGR